MNSNKITKLWSKQVRFCGRLNSKAQNLREFPILGELYLRTFLAIEKTVKPSNLQRSLIPNQHKLPFTPNIIVFLSFSFSFLTWFYISKFLFAVISTKTYSYITDINECSTSTDDCHSDATCSNTVGSFTCACKTGYQGNGKACTGSFIVYFIPYGIYWLNSS